MTTENIYVVVKKIVDTEDPLRLIEMGAPTDEYSLEIGEIAFRIVNKNVDKRIQDIVLDVFKEKFDEETVQNYQKSLETVGRKIEELLQK